MGPSTKTSRGASGIREGGVDAPTWTVEALCSVWEHQQDRVEERIAVIERALAALINDGLDTYLRRDAQRAAQMLAGSLGTFGFIAASEAARGLELGLARPSSGHAPALSALLSSVRSGVQGPVVLCSKARSSAHRS
jgi:HPt (histidine-containing phosphotransfer) domain-containing protein